mgnify:CR=1 FL=1
MGLWVESAYQELFPLEGNTGQRAVRTFQSEALYWVLLASAPTPGDTVRQAAGRVEQIVAQGQSLEEVVPAVLGTLPPVEKSRRQLLYEQCPEYSSIVPF